MLCPHQQPRIIATSRKQRRRSVRRVIFSYRYRAAIVDEAQDVGAPEMRLLLALVGQGPDSLVLLGDSRQQIYARGSFIRTLNLPIGRRHTRLRVNYRTTKQICAAATAVLTTADALTGEKLSQMTASRC